MMATIRWRRSSGGEQTITLDLRDASFGRTADNTICIDSSYVSKHHAVLRATPAGWTLADLGSSNGTLVNGQPATHATLGNGDTIRIGQEEFVFEAAVTPPAAPAAAAPAGKPKALVVLIGVAGLVLLTLIVLVIVGGRGPADTTQTAAPSGAAPTPGSASATGPVFTPPAVAPPAAVAAAPTMAPGAAPAVAVPDIRSAVPPVSAAAPLGVRPDASAGALYDLAIANIKGGRLVEARKLLIEAVTRDPGSLPARERLRQVGAAIQIESDRHLTAGQRAFTYLKYQDAIIEWEQVVAMTSADDARHRQAAEGIQRARARLAPQ